MIKIGIASMAHLHTESYAAQLKRLPDVEFAGVWDDDPQRLQRETKAYGVAAFAKLDDLLGRCDAVVVGSENIHHRRIVERAAAAGKHVLCEKPLATTPADARAMIDACEAAGVQLMTAFPTRFSPAFERLKASVLHGELGEILAVCATNRGRCPGGWFVDKSLSGGGAVMDHTVHVADLLRALLHADAETVHCEADNRVLHGSVEDTGFLTLTFGDRTFATLDASWSRPQTFPTWGDVTMTVTGTRGVIEMDMFGQAAIHYNDKTGKIAEHNWGSDLDRAMVAAFVRSLETGQPVPIPGLDGLRAVEVVDAAYRSIASGQPETVRHL